MDAAKVKSIFLKIVLDKINSSKKLQKLPHKFPIPAMREGSFCKFLNELFLSSKFLRKRTLLPLQVFSGDTLIFFTFNFRAAHG